VNCAIDHVVGHLGEPLRLADVAAAAGLSPFHFHRVFQMIVGETLADFVKRQRLDKAVFLMCHGRRPSLTAIALACGFASSSDFSRCFKQRFGAAPSGFDIKAWREAHGAELEGIVAGAVKGRHVTGLPRLALSDNPDGFKVRIRDLPARTVAYVRARNPYKGGVGYSVVQAFERLGAWAEGNSLADGQWLGFQWEHPEITPLEQCVYHAAVEVPGERLAGSGTKVKGLMDWGGEIGRFGFPAMVVAQIEMRGGIDLELRLFQWFYGVWLPKSGYVPDDHPSFEAFIGRPFGLGMEHFELNVQVPVRRG
jgi:AraC family transcriptional regulator